jgi:aminoglycoside/choline kinase family phosphotransferase
MELLKQLFEQYTGFKPETINSLSPAGSNRRYYRLKAGDVSLIGVEGTSIEENRAFIAMAKHFNRLNLPVPQLLLVSDDGMSYLQEDIGDLLLFDAISSGRKSGSFNNSEVLLLKKAITELPHFQIEAHQNFDYSVCYPQPEFNQRSVLWDLNYFKYSFLKIIGQEFQENHLEDDFERFAQLLVRNAYCAFMYRDFQSRNVMVKDDKVYFIDFQGGRKGPVVYDLVSFLWQAKAGFPDSLRNELIDLYISELKKLMSVDEADFRKQIGFFALFRTLQVLGAYGFRGYIEKKAHFLESIPQAIENLKELLPLIKESMPYLSEILSLVVDNKRFKNEIKSTELLVTIYSFSYKKGIPDDFTGNGGGYVFDCRAIHNPGKYTDYKQLTGMDKPVQQFLEQDGEILSFLKHVFALTDASVDRYSKRGFTDLMISFGCTGGQHRSVYSAQKTAEHIREKFGCDVKLIHREQGIEINL